MTFQHDETGAVTVDWVVLTAALLGLGLATMSVVSSGVEDLSGDVEDQLKTNHIMTSFQLSPHDAWLAALIATCSHSVGWGCEGQAAYDNASAALPGKDDSLLQTEIDYLDSSRKQHEQKIGEFATMLENWDPENPDYSVFEGLWTTWDDAAYIESRMAFHEGGDPAAYAVYLDNQVELLYQQQRAFEEEALSRPTAGDFTTYIES